MNNEEYRRFLGIKSDEERKEREGENIKDKIDEIKCIKDCIESDEKKLEKVKCV